MNKKRLKFSAIALLLILGHLCLCSGEKNKSTAETVKQNTPAGDSKFDETAMLFAGRIPSESSTLHKFSKSQYYTAYSKEITAGWKRFQEPNLNSIKEWWPKHAPAKYPSTVMYPFSGPDIMNALTFFPDADKYIMFGLEPPGRIPNPHGMSAAEVTAGLNGLRKSLNSIYHVNFFKTKNMAVEIGNKSFNTVGGLLMFFLSLNGYTILDVKKIIIDEKSNIAAAAAKDELINWTSPPKSRVPGIEIAFRKQGGKIQIVRYYMLNVIDEALKRSSPNFIPYLAKEGPYATVVKSASYLMHNDKEKFTGILAGVMNNTEFIIQDDSGVPLRQFDTKKWDIKFHGYYDRPISLFAHRMQSDFKAEMDKKSTGILPFSYGYDYQKGKSNLMSAARKKSK